MKYPVIYYPFRLEQFFSVNLRSCEEELITERFIAPKKPITPNMPQKPAKYFFMNEDSIVGIGIISVQAIIGLIILFNYLKLKWNNAPYYDLDFIEGVIFIYIIECLFVLIFMFSKISLFFRLLLLYSKEKRDYKKGIENYPILNDQYAVDVIKYEESLSQYNSDIRKFKNSSTCNALLLQVYDNKKNNYFSHYTCNISKPEKSIVETTKGITERYFYKYLIEIFSSDSILINQKVCGFYPDFVYTDNSGIFIDIEIDEPYVGNTKEIIHYYEISTNKHSDDKRNNILLENNWIIVRFTEQQIVDNPYGCCKVLAEIIKISNNNNSFIDKLVSFPNLEKQNFWTKNEAAEMALFDYRTKYLKDKIV